jgi:hypothetical protein
MVKIGFLACICPFTWREDLQSTIKDSLEWRENPSQFCLFFGSISSNKKEDMGPVLMNKVERDNIPLGSDYFCNMFDGDSPLPPCGIPYFLITLYQNTLSDDECIRIIHDINHHVGQYQLIRLYGLRDVDMLVTLKQQLKVPLRKLLLNLRSSQSSNKLFTQVEKENVPDSILCSFDNRPIFNSHGESFTHITVYQTMYPR